MLDWITTIPGILIVCGIVLLVIAIILFVLGARKSKKEEMPSMNSMSSADMTTQEIKAAGEINDIQNITTPEPIQEPEMATYGDPQVVSIPTENEVINNEPFTVDMPKIEPMPEVVNNMEATQNYNFNNFEEKPVTIYGGNDPLEATQTLPKMEEHHVPYGGEYQEVKVVEPTIEMPTPIVVDEVVPEMPTPIAVEEVISTPAVDEVVAEQPAVVEDKPVFDFPTPVADEVVQPVQESTIEEL